LDKQFIQGKTSQTPLSDSCLITKLSNYINLSEHDINLVLGLEEHEESFKPRSTVRNASEPVEKLYVVKDGWLFSYTTLPDGGRQVLQLHFPGDIVGIPDIAFDYTTVSLETIEHTVLCPFPKRALDQVFLHSPRLTALLFSFGMVDYNVLLDRIRAISRMNSYERIAHFILEIRSRLKITRPQMANSFELPLTQELIGDAVGLTNVHVSKSLTKLQDMGLLRRIGRTVELLDEAAIRNLVDFRDRYFKIDTAWFPAAR